MHRGFWGFLGAVAFLVVFNLIANGIAQALYPTKVSDSGGRRFAYRLIFLASFAASILVLLGILALFHAL